MKSLPSSKTVLMGLYNGLLESAHAVTICRAVRYFLPCDLDLSEGKKNEGCIGLFCPCFLFGKNAEFLGSGTFMGSCMTHFILWVLVNTVCCLLTEGLVLGVPGCFVACYACGYRRTLRSKYNLQEAPCGDFVTHFFCHLCAICQEYREIREKSADSGFPDLSMAVVTAPPVQTMEPGLEE
ncbi:PREDICTED: protein PLANT CADMIUM RESISTANCE 10 isoform X2 [Prunus mume]|uniref:Protein PLANT CADMIUM RESISTANCE 10 isoform X2 n=1 Tax=Prunus mume TaxID=102107 RepID=A0ABM0PJV3_PRUMU|nr:PREDICTED: protein PLANT CADMIUM RESISTANCE 10 isoform X2 [Prunus mume]